MVAKVASPCLVEIEGEVLDPNDFSDVRSNESDVGHDGDDHVLFHVEPARVKIPPATENGEFLIGKDGLEEFSSRESTEKGLFVTRMKTQREVGAHSNWAALEPTEITGYRMLKN